MVLASNELNEGSTNNPRTLVRRKGKGAMESLEGEYTVFLSSRPLARTGLSQNVEQAGAGLEL